MGFSQSVEETLQNRKKRLRFRAWHRGMRELDLILGPYVDGRIADLSPTDMDALETLFDVTDTELYSWICGRGAIPAEQDTPCLRDLISSAAAGRGTK